MIKKFHESFYEKAKYFRACCGMFFRVDLIYVQEGGDGWGGREKAAVGGDHPLCDGPRHTRHVQEQ